ncbi:MAG: TIGR00341 family protein [Hyphomonadaceae bacterium]
MKLIRLTYPTSHTDSVHRAIDGSDPIDWSCEEEPDRSRATAQILLDDGEGQTLMDALQNLFGDEEDWRLVLMDVEATLPRLKQIEDADAPASKPKDKDIAMREVLFEQVSRDSRINIDFIVLTVLSAVVAAIGLNGDSVAVVIAAMVIAPLLGPILGFSLGSALGSTDLMRKSAATAMVGLGIGFITVFILSVIFPVNLESRELIARTIISPDIVVLALASGAAAALSMTGGLSSTLVGVMVAVALLPPSAASAMYLGEGQFAEAAAAAILVALNIVCALLSAQIVFAWKGVRPRRWLAQKAVERQQKINYAVWCVLLVALFGVGFLISG